MWLALWVLSQSLGVGCLVTEAIDFEDEADLPTTISAGPQSLVGIGEPFWIDRDQLNESGELQMSWKLDLRLRDENLGDLLEARWRVLTVDRSATPPFECRRLSGGLEPVRTLTLEITSSDLVDNQCHRLELIATRADSFQPFQDDCTSVRPIFFEEVHSNDAPPARVSWAIFEGRPEELQDREQAEAFLQSCQAEVALLGSGEGS